MGGVVLIDQPKTGSKDAGDEGTDNNCDLQPPHLATPQARMGSGVNEFTQAGHALSLYTLHMQKAMRNGRSRAETPTSTIQRTVSKERILSGGLIWVRKDAALS